MGFAKTFANLDFSGVYQSSKRSFHRSAENKGNASINIKLVAESLRDIVLNTDVMRSSILCWQPYPSTGDPAYVWFVDHYTLRLISTFP